MPFKDIFDEIAPVDIPAPSKPDIFDQIESDSTGYLRNKGYKRNELLGQMRQAQEEGDSAASSAEFASQGVQALEPMRKQLVAGVSGQEAQDALDYIGEALTGGDHGTPSRPVNPIVDVAAGVQRSVAKQVTPENLALLGLGGAGPIVQKLAATKFTHDIASAVPQAAEQFGEATVTGTPGEMVESGLDLGGAVVLPGLTGSHAIMPIKAPTPTFRTDMSHYNAWADAQMLPRDVPLGKTENLSKEDIFDQVAKEAPIEIQKAAPEVSKPVEPVQEAGPVVPQAQTESGPPQSARLSDEYTPALRTKEGKIIPGEKGKTHNDIYESTKAKNPEEGLMLRLGEPEHGFVKGGEFKTREETSQALGETEPMQSERLREIQSKPEPERVKLRGTPQTFSVLERPKTSELETSMGESPIKIKNERTGEVQTVLEKDIVPVKKRFGKGGPGAAAEGEPGSYDPASQLTDQLATIKETNPLKRTQQSSRIADLWADGKSKVEQAYGKAVALKDSIKRTLTEVPERTPVEKLTAALDFQIQSSSARSRDLGKAFEKAHPEKVRRNAMAIFVDSGMDVGKIKEAIAQLPPKTPPYVKRAFEAATNLSEHEIETAQMIKRYFDQRLEDAKQAGVLKGFLEDYYTHIWKDGNRMPKALVGAMNSGRIVSYFENARNRKLDTFIDGVKLGLEPVLDPSLVLPRYNFNLDRSIASRAFVKKLTETKEADGRPTAAPTGIGVKVENAEGKTESTLIKPGVKGEEVVDYKTVDNPALTKWKWVQNDSEGKPIMVEGDLAIHPDAIIRVKNMMDRARLTATAPVRTAIRVGAEVKGAKLGILSPFHQIHVGSHAVWHLVNPFKVAEIDWTAPETKFAVESGLKLAADFHDKTQFSEGIGPGLIAQKIVPYSRQYSEYLFEGYIPRLKLKTFDAVYQRDLKRYAGKLSQDQIASRSADAVNSAYGELNRLWLGKDGRDPRLQRAMQVTLLAPDFLEARGRFVGKAFTKFGGEERMALFVMGAGLYTAARALNQLEGGDPHMEPGMMFKVRHNGKNYSVRSVIGDTTHFLTDWRSFWAHRINPATTRTAVEAISGRELRTGLKRDTQGQIEDLLRQIVPAQMDSMLPGDREWYEGLIQSLGVTSEHHQTPEEIAKREAKAKKDKENPPAFEMIYNPAHKKKVKTH